MDLVPLAGPFPGVTGWFFWLLVKEEPQPLTETGAEMNLPNIPADQLSTEYLEWADTARQHSTGLAWHRKG